MRLRDSTLINPVIEESSLSTTFHKSDEWKTCLKKNANTKNTIADALKEGLAKPAKSKNDNGATDDTLRERRALKAVAPFPKWKKKGTLTHGGRGKDVLVIAKCSSVYCRRMA